MYHGVESVSNHDLCVSCRGVAHICWRNICIVFSMNTHKLKSHNVAYALMHAHPVNVRHTWVTVGNNIDCSGKSGEIFLQSSRPKISSVDQCKQLCRDADGCQSITYFRNTGWCSHFSTPCTNTIAYSQPTVVLRLVEEDFKAQTTNKASPGNADTS